MTLRKYAVAVVAFAVAMATTIALMVAFDLPGADPDDLIRGHFLGKRHTAETLPNAADTIVVAKRGDEVGTVFVGGADNPEDPGVPLDVFEFDVITAQKGEPANTILVGTPLAGALDLDRGSKVKLLYLVGDAFPGVLDGEIIYQPVMMEQGSFDQRENGSFAQEAGRIIADANGKLRNKPVAVDPNPELDDAGEPVG